MLLLTSVSVAVERSVSTQLDEQDKAIYNRYIDQLVALKQKFVSKTIDISDMANCHKVGHIYTSSGCVSPFPLGEQDSSKKSHVSSEPASCSDIDAVQHWDEATNTWGCKQIRNLLTSTPPSVSNTWQLDSAESCNDLFMRNCIASDDTCPGTANPFGTVCSSATLCRYVAPDNKSLLIYSCK